MHWSRYIYLSITARNAGQVIAGFMIQVPRPLASFAFNKLLDSRSSCVTLPDTAMVPPTGGRLPLLTHHPFKASMMPKQTFCSYCSYLHSLIAY